jgi:hypothetical protein
MVRNLPFGSRSRQFPDPQILELDRGALRFEAEIPGPRFAISPAGNFLSVDPETNFSVDCTYVIVVSFVDALAECLDGKLRFPLGATGLK